MMQHDWWKRFDIAVWTCAAHGRRACDACWNRRARGAFGAWDEQAEKISAERAQHAAPRPPRSPRRPPVPLDAPMQPLPPWAPIVEEPQAIASRSPGTSRPIFLVLTLVTLALVVVLLAARAGWGH